jgi:hypothetical protein
MKLPIPSFAAAALIAALLVPLLLADAHAQGMRRCPDGTMVPDSQPCPSFKAPTTSPQKKTVGTCNSAKGCHALEKACLKLKGHTYTETKSGGLCQTGATSSASVQGSTAFADKQTGINDAKCFSIALCNKLRNTCQGEYVHKMPGYGVCKDEPSR